MRATLGTSCGMLVANPSTRPTRSPAEEMAGVIEAATAAARVDGITESASTPYLLAKILELTDSRSLRTNIALVEHNARLAARIAKAVAGALNRARPLRSPAAYRVSGDR